MFGTCREGVSPVALRLPTVGPERDDNGDDRVQRRRGGGESVPPASRRSLWPQPRGPGRRAPRRRCLVETAEGASPAMAVMQAGEGDLAIADLDLPPTPGLAEDGWGLGDLPRAP